MEPERPEHGLEPPEAAPPRLPEEEAARRPDAADRPREPDFAMIVGAALYFVASLLPWYGVRLRAFGVGLEATVNGWNVGTIGPLAALAAVATGVFAAAWSFGKVRIERGAADTVLLGLAGATFVLTLIRFAVNPASGFATRRIGIFLALALSAAMTGVAAWRRARGRSGPATDRDERP